MMEAASTATATAADPSETIRRESLASTRRPQPARITDDTAARRLRGHRDGALVLRSPAGAAAGDRPEVVRRDGGRRGLDRGGAPGRSRRHPRPQRRPARRLGRGTDGGRGPGVDAAGRPRAGEVPRRPARHRLLRHPATRCGPRAAASSTSPARSPRPWPPTSWPRPTRWATRGCPRAATRPATTRRADVAANLVGFLGTPDPEEGERPLAGFELTFDKLLSGTDGSAHYQVSGGNRIPLGVNTIDKAVDGQDLHTTHRRRPAVVRPARGPPGRRGRPRRLGPRDRHGRPHR